jgi:polysaccharide deacetylase family protein (PEP-CTERM system associated)
MMSSNIFNAMSVDVEDYYHVSNFSKSINKCDWDSYESRVESNTDRLLELFNNHDIEATFFVLGWIAKRHPELVHRIYDNGHEVACHGYSHDLIYNQTPSVFRKETLDAKRILEDIIQEPVIGYRAASYSITDQSIWALDILEELGFKYDSSIFPIRHDRYGIPGAPTKLYTMNTPSGKTIIEFPLSTIDFLKLRIPVSGGGYFRIFPYFLTQYAFNKKNKAGQPIIFYLHPWEIDPDQPKIKTNALAKFRHYHNLTKCESRLHKLISTFKFTRIDKILIDSGIL